MHRVGCTPPLSHVTHTVSASSADTHTETIIYIYIYIILLYIYIIYIIVFKPFLPKRFAYQIFVTAYLCDIFRVNLTVGSLYEFVILKFLRRNFNSIYWRDIYQFTCGIPRIFYGCTGRNLDTYWSIL